MSHLTEDDIEYDLIAQLQAQGYIYYHDQDIAPDASFAQRTGLDQVILSVQLKKSLKKLNPSLPESARVDAYRQLINLGGNNIITHNEKFHKMMTDGITVEYFRDGKVLGMQVKVLDFQNPANNDFWVVNQFVIKENNQHKRLDVVLFINGLPLVVIELKNPIREKATLERAFTQIQNYKKAIPSIFYYNAFCIISDGIEARASTISSGFSRYSAWKSPMQEENGVIPELHILAERMLQPAVVLNLIRFNTVFESDEFKDPQTGLLSLIKIKKMAAYHQYYVVEKAIKSTIRALYNPDIAPQIAEDPAKYGLASVNDQPKGDKRAGVVWHTQGSGKSLSMVFYAAQLVVSPALKNPTIIVLTDRNDLDDQLFATFGNATALLRQTPVQAENRQQLKELLRVTGGGIIFTTIQKFHPGSDKSEYERLSDRGNIVVVADEAHRSQYGFTGKIDKKGQLKYGNAKYMRDAVPNATYIGFTGTPISHKDRNTRQVFGNYIDVYDIAQAVEDKATVPLSFESRLVKINFTEEKSQEVDRRIDALEGATEEQIERAKQKNSTAESIVGESDRLTDIATDFIHHFEARQVLFEGKALIVCMSRSIAIDLYNLIVARRPAWHDEDLSKGEIKVVITSTSDDDEKFQPHQTNKKDRKFLATRIKDSNDPLKIAIVQSMWLTGFDAPPLHTIYIDDKMKGAKLMQAIARVNRVYKDKPGGLVVDYIGIGEALRDAMSVYTASGGQGKAVQDLSEIILEMQNKFDIVRRMFHGFDYQSYFNAPTSKKLTVLLACQNFILNDESLKKRFLNEVTKLSRLYVLAVPSKETGEIKAEVAFFQDIKSRINKFTPQGGKTNYEVNMAVRQIVNEALASDGVIDIFEAAGIEKPSVSILSESFLLKVKEMEHQNLAFHLLKKILNDEVHQRKSKNKILAKKFSEMLRDAVTKYHNNQIDAAEVIKKLSELAREMRLEDNKAEELGLTPEEHAFYTILAQNKSTEHLKNDQLIEVIHLIVDVIRKNATVDWSKREDVKARLRLLVKKILMKYGYPPDLARIEADKVIAQSEILAQSISEQE